MIDTPEHCRVCRTTSKPSTTGVVSPAHELAGGRDDGEVNEEQCHREGREQVEQTQARFVGLFAGARGTEGRGAKSRSMAARVAPAPRADQWSADKQRCPQQAARRKIGRSRDYTVGGETRWPGMTPRS